MCDVHAGFSAFRKVSCAKSGQMTCWKKHPSHSIYVCLLGEEELPWLQQREESIFWMTEVLRYLPSVIQVCSLLSTAAGPGDQYGLFAQLIIT